MNIMNALLEALTQTEEWKQMQQAPVITEAMQGLQEAVESLTAQQQEEIMAAAYMYATACERAALLFGIGLTDKIRAAGADRISYLQAFGD